MQGYLLLCVAADAEKMDVVDRLLSQGVDVNAYGRTSSVHPEVDAMLARLADSSQSRIRVACNDWVVA